ncbi:MAG: hypothetical protein CMI81_02435 [Candidatus Pelagibacter sp.]|nr:hypothetical protein [Candidatus Pelagibacter sp.]OUV97556.1 MAG: hypothetical protein CBD02_03040 [Candidatus Pelagibacter sp. TMED142]
MTITGAIVIYVIIWWIVFFTILPLNIKSQLDNQKIYPGSEPSAPSDPKIKKRIFSTTLISTILFIIIYILTSFNIINIRELLS